MAIVMMYHITCAFCGAEADKRRSDGRPPSYCSRACWVAGDKEAKKLMRSSTNYWTVHRRVRNDRGRASQYPCARCGAPARDWGMRHGTDGSDPAMFDPLCRKCHVAYDGTAEKARTTARRLSPFRQRDSYGRYTSEGGGGDHVRVA